MEKSLGKEGAGERGGKRVNLCGVHFRGRELGNRRGGGTGRLVLGRRGGGGTQKRRGGGGGREESAKEIKRGKKGGGSEPEKKRKRETQKIATIKTQPQEGKNNGRKGTEWGGDITRKNYVRKGRGFSGHCEKNPKVVKKESLWGGGGKRGGKE